jgi:hypothetical protein
MKPIWLIEAGVYGTEVAPLVDEIRRQGITAAILPHRTLVRGPLPMVAGRPLERDDCVLGYGTFPFARQIQLHHKWAPGAWCNSANLDCATYYAHFGPFLLNWEYAILPGVEAIRQQDWLYRVFGERGQVFVRPTGCQKLFPGRCVPRDDFSTALAPTRYDPATLVVIARPRPVLREWRLVVVDGQVVAASQYAENGVLSLEAGCPERVKEFAQSVLHLVKWRPDPAFMMDVGLTEWDNCKLVELNSFSGSWLYQCDLAAVVAAAGDLAQHEWQRAQELGEHNLAAVF